MNARWWKKKIIEATEKVKTYKPEFDSVIDTLADILEQRDRVYQDFLDTGAQVIVIKTSDRGAENETKNPRLQLWSDLNSQALMFWRDLGLTPAGLKKINDASLKVETKGSMLEKALMNIGKE